MIGSSLRFTKCCSQIKTLLNSHIRSATTTSSSDKWDIFTAVCVERKPVISKELNEIEQDYQKLMRQIEFERSLKCEHELKHEMDLKHIAAIKKGKNIDDVDVSLKQTAQDLVDAWTEELSKFKPASRITEADQKNDMKSLQRKLDRHLVLVVNQKLGDKKYFLLPQARREDGETLRQTAERVLKQSGGNNLKVQIYGNAPSGFYKYKYPKKIIEQTGLTGAKVFIYFARYLNGQLPEENLDYRWLDRQELKEILPAQYSTSVSQLLIDE